MLLYQTLLYLPAQFLAPLFQFVAAVVWTHWLAPGPYGQLAYVLAAQELAFVLGLSWWSQYTLRYLPSLQTQEARARYQTVENTVLLLSAVLQGAVAVVNLALIGAPLTAALVVPAAVYTVSRSIITHLGERARSGGDVMAYTVVQIASSAVGFFVAFGMIEAFSASPAVILTGFAIAQVGALVWLIVRMHLRASIGRPDASILATAVRYGLPIVASGAIGWISLNGIRLVVEHGASSEAVGLVSVGWGLGQRISSVGAMLVTAATFPLAVRMFHSGGRARSLQQLSTNGALLLGLIAPMAAGTLFITPPLVGLLIAQPFRAVTLAVLPIAVLAGAVRNLRLHFADQVFLLLERTQVLILVNAVEAILVLVLCGAGLALYGLAGAAAGCLAGIAVATALCFALAVRQHGLELPVRHGARIAAATAAMALALALPSWPGGLAGLAEEVVVGALVYGAALAALYPGALRRLRP